MATIPLIKRSRFVCKRPLRLCLQCFEFVSGAKFSNQKKLRRTSRALECANHCGVFPSPRTYFSRSLTVRSMSNWSWWYASVVSVEKDMDGITDTRSATRFDEEANCRAT
ncbi:unnamed protein product [Ectocarpus sp. 8 AP-2014]